MEEDKKKEEMQMSRDAKSRKKSQPTTIPRSKRAGLVFPVGRCHRHMRDLAHPSQMVASTAATYATGVMEYMVAEVLTLTGDICYESGDNRITPHHLQTAVKQDVELTKLIDDTIKHTGLNHWELLDGSEDESAAPPPPPPPPARPPTPQRPVRRSARTKAKTQWYQPVTQTRQRKQKKQQKKKRATKKK